MNTTSTITQQAALDQLDTIALTTKARGWDGDIVAALRCTGRTRDYCPAMATVISITRSMILRRQYDAAYWTIRDQRIMDEASLSHSDMTAELGREHVQSERGYHPMPTMPAYLIALSQLEHILDGLRNAI